jgi:hypothetical protein
VQINLLNRQKRVAILLENRRTRHDTTNDANGCPGHCSETVESNRKKIKHIGKLKDGGAAVAIIFRTVPGEPKNCLVDWTKILRYELSRHLHESTGKCRRTKSAFELGHHLMKSRFSDGVEILPFLHQNNFIKKMPTENVIVTMGAR